MFEDQIPPKRSAADNGASAPRKTKKTSEVVSNGLRYKSKPTGSPFTNQSGFGSTMSCFKCGKHRPSADLETKKLLGKNHKVCKGGCAKV